MEYVKPIIFANSEVLCGMTKKGNPGSFPPSGFSCRQLSLTDEEFAIHKYSMESTIGNGLGKRIVTIHQVHGNLIHDASLNVLPDGDGLHTNDPAIMLGIALADCCGIMIHDPKHHAVMALHAGWRGAKAGIGTKGIDIMNYHYGSNPEDLHIWLTPCAGAENYQVGEEFLDYFPGFVESRHGAYYLDLRGYITKTLIEAGVRPDAIESSDICTIQDQSFHSYRREGNLGRNLAFLGLF